MRHAWYICESIDPEILVTREFYHGRQETLKDDSMEITRQFTIPRHIDNHASSPITVGKQNLLKNGWQPWRPTEPDT
jgi:hypothetical protein